MRHRGRKTLDMGSAQEFRAHSFPGCCNPCGRALKVKTILIWSRFLIYVWMPVPMQRSLSVFLCQNLCEKKISLLPPLRKKRIHVALGMGGKASGNKVKKGESRRRAVSCRQAKVFMVLNKKIDMAGGWANTAIKSKETFLMRTLAWKASMNWYEEWMVYRGAWDSSK